ncbi:hypothetical protein ACH0BF_24945 [Pseudobacillus sp. 179-B 2D1 NHS]|uniref:hypothetical protein n=1 Tax=Pseudobacillus sp. 179-B 2D1 NHS TaxID=3374292 RepID=UPI0038792E16
MKKKNYLILIGLILVILAGVYGYYSSVSLSGVSENNMWKATYKKNLDASEPTGWVGELKQKNDRKVNVKSIVFTDDEKVLAKKEKFAEGKAEDGSVTTLHPFSAEFYLGDAPNKKHTYKVSVTWEENKESHIDTFEVN